MAWHPGQETPLDGPYVSLKAVSPSNTVDLPDGPCSALYCSGAGNVNIDTVGGDTAVIAISAGWTNLTKILVKRVRSTSTTATGIIACY
jgi:hypothetical protein